MLLCKGLSTTIALQTVTDQVFQVVFFRVGVWFSSKRGTKVRLVLNEIYLSDLCFTSYEICEMYIFCICPGGSLTTTTILSINISE